MTDSKSGYVDPYPGRKGSERIVEDCSRCGGSGLYVGPTNATFYTATVGDTAPGCFACKGTGKYSFLVSSARAKVRRHAREAKAAAEAVIKARIADFRAKHGPLADRAAEVRDGLRDGDPISCRLREVLDDLKGSALVEDFDADAWAERAAAVLTEFDEREAAKRPVPTGRIEVSGTIRSAKCVEGHYGSVLKMLVEGEAWKVWGSVPRNNTDQVYEEFHSDDRDPRFDGFAVWTQCLLGRSVTFTATVKASPDDPSFGFFTRPSKATIADHEAPA